MHRTGHLLLARPRLAVHEVTSATRGTERRAMWEYMDAPNTSTLIVVTGEDGSDRVRFVDSLRNEAKVL